MDNVNNKVLLLEFEARELMRTKLGLTTRQRDDFFDVVDPVEVREGVKFYSGASAVDYATTVSRRVQRPVKKNLWAAN